MKYYLYNSLANNGIKPEMAPGTELVDAVGLNYPEYLNGLSPEDEVVLMGESGGECITAEDLARWSGTISYEILLSVGSRVERVFRDE